MNKRHYKYLFGPVPSRRLGRSLGVDLTPFKTCSFDCIFCQLGRTTDKTVKRKEYVPVKEVIAEYSSDASAKVRANEEDILEMLERRPCTLDQICRVFGLHRNEALKYLGKLVRTGTAQERRKEGEVYYSGIHRKEAIHAHL